MATLLLTAMLTLAAYPAHSQDLNTQDKATLTKILKDNETKRPDEATVAQVQQLVDKYPKDYFARLVMGNTLDRVGMPLQAIEQYQMAVQNGPNSPKAIIELVKAEIGVGQKEAAMRLLKEADKRFPNDREIMFWMGNYYLAKGDVNEAQQKLDQVSRSGQQMFGIATSQAEIHLRKGRAGLASWMVDRDLQKNPEYPLANAVKGEALFMLRRYQQSVPYLKNAYIAFPLQGDYAKRLTTALLATNEFKTALEPALVALALSSKVTDPDRETQWLVAMTLSSLPKEYVRAEAPKTIEKLDKQINNGRWHFVLGELFDFYGLHDLGAVQFYRSYQIDPSQPLTAFRLANDLEMYFQQYDEAVKYLTQAHTLSPGDQQIADRLERLQNRLAGRNADLAWQLKDMLRKRPSPI